MIGMPLGETAALFIAFRHSNPRPWKNKPLLKASSVLIGLPLALALLRYRNGDYGVESIAYMFVFLIFLFIGTFKKIGTASQEVIDENRQPDNIPPNFQVIKSRFPRLDITYMVMFLGDRLLFVEVGNRLDILVDLALAVASAGRGGSGSARLGSSVARMVVGTVNDVIKTSNKNDQDKKLALAKLSEELLKCGKDNFEILYSDITSVKLKKDWFITKYSYRLGTFTIKGKRNEKFEIGLGMDFDSCVNIVKSFLPDKLM